MMAIPFRHFAFLVILAAVFGLSGCGGTADDVGTAMDIAPRDAVSLPAKPDHQFFRPEGGTVSRYRIHPPSWWVDMPTDTLQLLIHDRDIRGFNVVADRRGVEVVGIDTVANPNYLFVSIKIGKDAIPGRFSIRLEREGDVGRVYPYELQRRIVLPGRMDPLNSDDLIYTVVPDRFANGDSENDNIESMLEGVSERTSPITRHGGDLQGLLDRLDYIQALGVTCVRLTSPFECNNQNLTYSGDGVTDFYSIDPRLGSSELFIQLASQCQARNLKLIVDLPFNDVGRNHWFVQDIPSVDWLHQYPSFTKAHEQVSALWSPYATTADKQLLFNGWLDELSPDLNQDHPLLAAYLLQTAIWWVETTGIDGFHLVHSGNIDQPFVQRLVDHLRSAYPDFVIYGDSRTTDISLQSRFTGTSKPGDVFSRLSMTQDHVFRNTILDVVSDGNSPGKSVKSIYDLLAGDPAYNEPSSNITFLDEPFESRLFTILNGDQTSVKSAITLMMTLRGIPMISAGTEIGEANTQVEGQFFPPDFAGGWPGDNVNAFDGTGLSDVQQELSSHFTNIANTRNESTALKRGVLTMYAPVENPDVLVYFRSSATENFMILFNGGAADATVSLGKYRDLLGDIQIAYEVSHRQFINLLQTLVVPAKEVLVLDLNRD